VRGALALATALLVALPAAAPAARRDAAGLGALIAGRLMARKALAPRTHTTDFAGDEIGCITLTRRELRRFGYRGHAFLCEEAATAEVLGAVLDRAGVVRCYVTGGYAGGGCYDLEICGTPELACVE
jgi:hypothetical protein